VASRSGSFDVELPPGIYRVRAISGDATLEEYRVLAAADDARVQFRAETSRTARFVPLREHARLIDEHAGVAARISATPTTPSTGRARVSS